MYTADQLEGMLNGAGCGPAAERLHDALAHTGHSSIDAMLETRDDIARAGKTVIARFLLQQERAAKDNKFRNKGGWYHTLFAALDAPTVQETIAQPITFVSFNYDRSLEYYLSHALRVKFSPDEAVAPTDLRKKFIHVHGQLGFLPELGTESGRIVHFGGSQSGISDDDVRAAADEIRIVHEPKDDDPRFSLAREAIRNARRLVFLGFGFAPRNLARLDIKGNLNPTTSVFATATNFSTNQMYKFVDAPFADWQNKLIGKEEEDAAEFLRLYPAALES
jgi:hypothetical protein